VGDLSGERVWQAVLEEGIFLARTPKVLWPLYERHLKKLPEALGDLLSQQVTLATVLKAKAAFLDYSLRAEFINQAVAALPDDFFPVWVDRWELAASEASDTFEAMSLFDQSADNVALFLESLETTEEALLCGGFPGLIPLSQENAELYRLGDLTIADLLGTQPSIIIFNADISDEEEVA